jgi:hypothetical protein
VARRYNGAKQKAGVFFAPKGALFHGELPAMA